MALENDAAREPTLQKSPIKPWVRAVLLSWCVIAIASQLVALMLTCHVIPGRGSIGYNWSNFGDIRNPRPGYKVAAQPLPASQREFRPDEVELIDWATRQIGLDLHALKVEELEGETSDLRKEVSTLRSLLDGALIVASAGLRTTPDQDIRLAPSSGQANLR